MDHFKDVACRFCRVAHARPCQAEANSHLLIGIVACAASAGSIVYLIVWFFD